MKKIFRILSFSKRQQIVAAVIFLTGAFFISEYTSGLLFIGISIALSFLTVIFLYIAFRRDVAGSFFHPLLILPFLFTLAFALFYLLIPPRLISRLALTFFFSLGLYSLFLTQNIFAVSTIRTINLLRSARIVSFIITIIVLFLITNLIFSLRLPLYIAPFIVFSVTFLLSFQSFWVYTLNKALLKNLAFFSLLISLCLAELSVILNLWPINASIYSIFLTGIFYAYTGLTHAWIEKRLFKNVFFEYIWVGFLAILILIFFSKWGI